MKKTFLIALLAIYSFNAFSQVSFIGKKQTKENSPAQAQVFVYDSLQNLQAAKYKKNSYNEEVDHYGHFIGQTIIFIGDADGRYHNLKREITIGKGKKAYKTTQTAGTPEVGTEFTIVEVSPKKTVNSFQQNILLKENLTGERYILEPNTFGYTETEWIIKGFYEKMKQLYVGKTFYYINAFPSNDIDYCMRILDTNELMGTIENFSKWKCMDVSIKLPVKGYDDSEKCRIVLVFEDEKRNKYYSFIEKNGRKPMIIDLSIERKVYESGIDLDFIDASSDEFNQHIKYLILYAEINEKDIFLGKFLNEEQFQILSGCLKEIEEKRAEKIAAKEKSKEDEKKRIAERKNNLIKKYGKTAANDMLKGYVRIGWTKDMCIEAWGKPNNINRTTGSYGIHEQWVYGNGNYLYFENGKLTTIQN